MTFRVDLHIHTRVSSRDSDADPADVIEAARAAGLDAIAITEHEAIEGALVTRALGRNSGFLVLAGVEVRTDIGDLLVFGVERDFEPLCCHQALLAEVDAARGAVIAAHPYRNAHRSLGDRVATVDGVRVIEVHNARNPASANDQAVLAAHVHGLHGTGGSDAHRAEEVGGAVTVFGDRLTDERDLIEALRAGRFAVEAPVPDRV